ncbi:MAG: MFS transporter [Proteobacteria bacterium]|nr:MFS transporter [Pseudomonadota bacterium]
MASHSSGPLALLRRKDIRFYLAGRFFTGIAQSVQVIGVGLYVYSTTRDPLALGLAGLFTFLPQLLLVAVAGHVADSRDRRLITTCAYLVASLSAFGLLVLTLTGSASIPLIYLMISLVGVTRVFAMPAQQSLLPNLVPTAELPRAVAMVASTMQSATIIGPTLGGLIYILGPAPTFAAAAILHLVAAFSVFQVAPQMPRSNGERFSWSAFSTGAGFIWRNKVLLGALSLDMVAVLFAGVVALLPIYATDILNGGPEALGWLRASQAAGALTMALFLARFPIQRHAGRWLLLSCMIFGCAIIGFGFSRILWLSMLFMVIEGAADMVSVVVRLTLIQNDTPDEMRGRVGSVNSLFVGASNSLGEFESGLAASLIGTVPATILGGILCLLTTALWSVLFPALRTRDWLETRSRQGNGAQGAAVTSTQ